MVSRNRPRSVSGKNAALSPPQATSPAAALDASNPKRRITRSLDREITAAQQQLQNVTTMLPPVDEQDDEPQPEQSDVENNDSSVPNGSSNGSSLIEALDALDTYAIIDNLGNLYTDSVKLLSVLENVHDDALIAIYNNADPNSRPHKNFQAQAKRLAETRTNYVPDPESEQLDFIGPDLILRKLIGPAAASGIPNGRWRPDAILYLANLAIQIVKVLSPSGEIHSMYLSDMFNRYPEQFIDLDYFVPSPRVYQGYHGLHVEILTHVFLDTVDRERGHRQFDPDDVLQTVFFDEQGRVKGWSNPQAMSKALERSEFIRGFFDLESREWINFEELKSHFPWSHFATQVVRWTIDLGMELKALVESRGGADTIVRLIQAGNLADDASDPDGDNDRKVESLRRPPESGADDNVAAEVEITPAQGLQGIIPREEEQRRASAGPRRSAPRASSSVPEEAVVDHNNFDRLQAAKAQYYATRPPAVGRNESEEERSEPDPEPDREIAQSPTALVSDEENFAGMDQRGPDRVVQTQDEQEPDDEPPQIQDDEDEHAEDEDIIATQQANLVLQVINRQKQQSNKENARAVVHKPSFLDRQAGAVREQWNDEFPNDEDPPRPIRRSPKRSRRQGDAESEDENEFEADKRPEKRPRLVVDRSGKPRASRVDRQEIEEGDAEGGGTDRTRAEHHAPQQRTRNSTNAPRGSTISPARQQAMPSSQPGPSNTQRSTSSRAPLQQISSSTRAMPSSSAPARSNTNPPSSSLQSSRRPPPSHQPPPRARSHHPSAPREPSPAQSSRRVPPSRQSPSRAHSRESSPLRELPSTQNTLANREAKRMVQMSRDMLQDRRQAQTRVGYSLEEVDRLMEMIALYGTQWARILREDNAHPDGPRLQSRNQVQLKDKARNMKLDWLKARRPLEPGFEMVSVGKAWIEKLRLMGVDYFEGDTAARFTGGAERDHDDDIDDD